MKPKKKAISHDCFLVQGFKVHPPIGDDDMVEIYLLAGDRNVCLYYKSEYLGRLLAGKVTTARRLDYRGPDVSTFLHSPPVGSNHSLAIHGSDWTTTALFDPRLFDLFVIALEEHRA